MDDTCENWPYPCDCSYCENRRRAEELEDLPALPVATGMETFVLVRDECLALANALTLAMVDGYSGSELAEVNRRCLALAGSLALFAAPRAFTALLGSGKPSQLANLARELEQERRETARLRDELVTARHEVDLASERASKAHEHADSAERRIAEMMLEFARLRGEIARP